MNNTSILEVVVETVEDALAADVGGADQLEVKCDYLEYGLTPTLSMLEAITAKVSCDILCMIRPHARSMVLSEFDLSVMEKDIIRAKQFPISGFLFGCLTEAGELDLPALKRLQQAAAPLAVHCHLVWEQTPSPLKSLEALVQLGFSSVRTSGGGGVSGNVINNAVRIREYAKLVDNRFQLFIAGGVRLSNLSDILRDTEITCVHTGSGMREPENRTGRVVSHKVQAMKEIIDRYKITND